MNFLGTKHLITYCGHQEHLIEQTLSLKGNISTHVKKCNTSPPIGFGNFNHGDTGDIISDNLIKDDSQHLNTFKQGSTTRYNKWVYERHKTGFPKNGVHQYYVNNKSYITRAIFPQTYIFLPSYA